MAVVPDYKGLAMNTAYLNACDMKKDQGPDFSPEAAIALTPDVLLALIDRTKVTAPYSKETMAGRILEISNVLEANIYNTLQEASPGTKGDITVRWSGDKYLYECFDGTASNVASSVKDFLGQGVGNICRIVDTTRGGNIFLAKYPLGDGGNTLNFIHAHTPPVDKDPCGKMNLKSAEGSTAEKDIFKKRYFWEQHPGAEVKGNPKIIYYPWETEADTQNPLYHMYLSRQLNLEYKSVSSDGRMDVELTILSKDKKKITRIDEKTNTAGAFQKIKQKVKKAFNVKTGTELQQIIQASKLNGDVGQVLEAHREFELINQAGEKTNSKDYSRLFEAYDFNAILKAFQEKVDIILLHTWKTGEGAGGEGANEKNFIVFMNTNLADKNVVLTNLKKNYEYLYDKIVLEVGEYNKNTDIINKRLEKFKSIIEQDVNVNANMENEALNDIYKDELKKYIKASILQKYLPVDPIVPMNNPNPKEVFDIANAITDEQKNVLINQIKTSIQELNNIRTNLLIPSIYTTLNVLNKDDPSEANDLADIDLEKQGVFRLEIQGGTLNSKMTLANIFSKIFIFTPIASSRAGALFSLTASFLGIQLIQFVLRNADKIIEMKKKFIQNLYKICKIKDTAAGGAGTAVVQKTPASKNFDKIALLLKETVIDRLTDPQKAEVAEGGRMFIKYTGNINLKSRKKGTIKSNIFRQTKKLNKLSQKRNDEREIDQNVATSIIGTAKSEEEIVFNERSYIEIKYKIKEFEIEDSIELDDLYDFLKVYLLEIRQIALLYSDIYKEDNDAKIKERVETFLTTSFPLDKSGNDIYSGGNKLIGIKRERPTENSNEEVNENMEAQLNKEENNNNDGYNNKHLRKNKYNNSGEEYMGDDFNTKVNFFSTFCAFDYDYESLNEIQTRIDEIENQIKEIENKRKLRSATVKLDTLDKILKSNKSLLEQHFSPSCDIYDENKQWHMSKNNNLEGGKRNKKLKIRKTKKRRSTLNKKTKKLRR